MVAPNAVAENVLGTIGAILWSFQVTPQIWKSYRRKDTTGLSARMLAIWFCSSIFLGGYVITQDLAVPLLLQPQLFGFFIAISWGQCLVYSFGKTQRYATCAVAFVCLAAGAIEVGLVYGARAAEARGYEQPTQTYGILSAVLIVVGIFPQYYEIYELKAVMGISMIFLFVDMGGAFFSTLSLIFTPGSFDITACASYASSITAHWSQKLLGIVNSDTAIKVAKLQGDFIFHSHDDTDELFYVLEGGPMVLKFEESEDVILEKGDMIVVPKGVRHCPCADVETTVMFIENIGAVNTGGEKDT
ncbi:hypothetical protein RQP46_006090 [Phenoliferia psychrophenolica]